MVPLEALLLIAVRGSKAQLGTMDYPRQWYEVKEYLNGDTKDFNVLFLPEDYTQ